MVVIMPMSTPESQRTYNREWVAARRRRWFAENGPCTDCGSWESLELDHVDQVAKVEHRIWSWAPARREAELAKCVVRCRPCHQAKTLSSGEYAWGERHGNARLCADDVRRIRASRTAIRASDLAAQYGLSRKYIYEIWRRQVWARLPD